MDITLDAINELLAGTKTRGDYKTTITNLINEGKVWEVVSEHPRFKGMKEASVVNSFTLNIGKLQDAAKAANEDFPELKCVAKEGTVVLINVDALKAAEAAQVEEV